MADIKESLGIPNFGPWYVQLLPDQDPFKELNDMFKFIKLVISNKNISEFNSDDISVHFINYGKTQLVFVATVDDTNQYTLLVNQPATKYGTGKNEFDNLNKLNRIDSKIVIKPMYYFDDNSHELYVTPYYHQARCIGVESSDWGVWIPEPKYHFENFNENDKKMINSSMVALLIKLYDEENHQGIAKCRLDGGDFMLLKGFEDYKGSSDNVLNYIKLIAARELVNISLDEYINKLKKELLNEEENELFITGRKLRCPFTIDEINNGIDMGLRLRKQNIQFKPKER